MVNELVSPAAAQLFVERLCSMLRSDGIECSPQRMNDLGFKVWLERENDHFCYWIYDRRGIEISLRDFLIELAADHVATQFKRAVNSTEQEVSEDVRTPATNTFD